MKPLSLLLLDCSPRRDYPTSQRSESIWRGDAAFPNMESFHLPQHGEAS
ncbi:hypothetical protein D8I24_4522 [Cupriavidus necator H850]|jgi:hypothetical protein|nr:hypothetical protein D8I24_4522 [Cupriavidus necator H850]